MIIAGVSAGLVPRSAVDTWERTDKLRHRRERTGSRAGSFGL
ncbi:hypothetical protein [Streptomyces aurantiacus]|nr:hypothetical protein [Streptomyces aurantiacus]